MFWLKTSSDIVPPLYQFSRKSFKITLLYPKSASLDIKVRNLEQNASFNIEITGEFAPHSKKKSLSGAMEIIWKRDPDTEKVQIFAITKFRNQISLKFKKEPKTRQTGVNITYENNK